MDDSIFLRCQMTGGDAWVNVPEVNVAASSSSDALVNVSDVDMAASSSPDTLVNVPDVHMAASSSPDTLVNVPDVHMAASSSPDTLVNVRDVMAASSSPIASGKEERGKWFDPMSAKPSRGKILVSRAQNESKEPDITSIVVDKTSTFLFMADKNNNSIKVISLESLDEISSVPLDVKPFGISLASDELLVVTSPHMKQIVVVDVKDKDNLVLKQTIETNRQYYGVFALPSKRGEVNRVVVSCKEDFDGPASVDVIPLDEKFIKDIVTSYTISDLKWPVYLSVHNSNIFISDHGSRTVIKIDMTMRHAPKRYPLPNPDNQPRQVCTDRAGRLYVASSGRDGQCVLVRSVNDDGRWKQLLTGEKHGENGYVDPRGLSVTKTGLVVSWDHWHPIHSSIVKKYEFL